MITTNKFIITFVNHYHHLNTNHIMVGTNSFLSSISIIPECLFQNSTYGIIMAIFDDQTKNKYQRWIYNPLQYSINYSLLSILNHYMVNSLNTLFIKKTKKNKIGIEIISSVSSSIIPYWNQSTTMIGWNCFLQVGSNMLITFINSFLD
ncbi:hypothetical protein KM1_199700 [Entamoeba histolytica HM-3:IMSS]|nr:hypothetical protein KM1_199700 [Entamoeba histolytica HM-3:IMSS]GAT97594.1 hypothetical protein CL6EHI_079210 [Entamoeba histolytica]